MRYAPLLLMLPASLFLSGCTTEFTNTRAARELRQPAPLVGNLYAGWRVFQDKCAACHGAAATGGERAPDLLPIVRDMSARKFTALVLKRYDLGSGLPTDSPNQATIDTRIEDILRGTEPPLEMPAWQGEPAVNAHVLDLYAYLSARADGTLDTNRPQR